MTDDTAPDTADAVETAEAAPEPPRRARWRPPLAWTLLVLGALLAILSVTAVWVRNLLLDTDRYVDTVAPLVDDEDIQQAAATRVTDALMGAVDVSATAEELLPDRAQPLAPAIEQAVTELVQRTTLAFFSSDQFETLWDEANRRAHTQISALLTGGGDFVSTDEGQVSLDLAAIAGAVRVRLSDRGLTIFDSLPVDQLATELQLVESDSLADAQDAVDLLQTLAWVLPVLMLVAFVGSVLLSYDRRRALWRVGIAVVVSMAVLMVAIALGRRFYLDALQAANEDAARAVFDTLTRYVRMAIRFIFGVGLIIALGSWVAGPSPSAVRLKAFLGGATSRAGQRLAGEEAVGGFAAWVADHRRGLYTGVAVVLAVLAMTADHPSLRTLLLALLLGGALFGAIAVIAARVDSTRAPTTRDTVPA